MKDLYKILGVDPLAKKCVIEAAYKALMKDIHPDVSKSIAGEHAKDLNEAHDILSDDLKRKDYDDERREKNPKIIGNYEVMNVIAEGGFGRTYKAKHRVNNELTCIKDCSNISKEDFELLIGESKTIWDLRHYALPAVRDLVEANDNLYLVMSYVPGPTLFQLVEKFGAIDYENVCWISDRIINAMNYCHRSGVIHGDIKPQNIIVQEDKHMAVLVDFGLSSVKPNSKTEAKGYTQFFASPEQMNGKPPLPESDYYSLGMTMLFALSGSMDWVEQKMVPKDVPDELCQFIKKLLARDVSNRPQYPKDDLGDMIMDVRQKVFGRKRSNLKPIGSKK
jgi:serine/threonine protein kinase